jgi:hypothetical protein
MSSFEKSQCDEFEGRDLTSEEMLDYNGWSDDIPVRDLEDDNQPDEYTEWQDYMGGDDPWQYNDEF